MHARQYKIHAIHFTNARHVLFTKVHNEWLRTYGRYLQVVTHMKYLQTFPSVRSGERVITKQTCNIEIIVTRERVLVCKIAENIYVARCVCSKLL